MKTKKFPSDKTFFHIYPPGSGQIVSGRSDQVQNEIIEDKIWRNYDIAMGKLRKVNQTLAPVEIEPVAGHSNAVSDNSSVVDLNRSQVAKKSTGGMNRYQMDRNTASGSQRMRSNHRYNLRSRKVNRYNVYKQVLSETGDADDLN